MNTPPTLDRFESALLGELRAHVATRPATAAPIPETPSRRHPRRWAAGLAAAAAAATAYVVVSPGGPAVSPAYAIDENADGDVVVTIHRLEDAEGLERALREHGIDAEVSFEPTTEDPNTFEFEAPDGDVGDAPPGGTTDRVEPESGGKGLVEKAEPGEDVELPEEPDCGIVDDASPATLSHEGDDWVLRIPAESPLQDRPVEITTGPEGELGVSYAGNEPGLYCAVMSVGMDAD